MRSAGWAACIAAGCLLLSTRALLLQALAACNFDASAPTQRMLRGSNPALLSCPRNVSLLPVQAGDTVLHAACHLGHLAIAALLLRSGARVDARDAVGWRRSALQRPAGRPVQQ